MGSSNRWRVCREFFAPFIQKRKEREPVRTGFLFVIIIIVITITNTTTSSSLKLINYSPSTTSRKNGPLFSHLQ